MRENCFLDYRCSVMHTNCFKQQLGASMSRDFCTKCIKTPRGILGGMNCNVDFIYLKNMRDTVAFCPKYDIIAHEMNNMQNRISCVKCSVDGELPPKRKVRLTI